ncbi:MAG: hypothetical protein U9R25_15880 [Chloroflexota bacterium]|nr:hypothetical protein [Chloroflexota bacterium]
MATPAGLREIGQVLAHLISIASLDLAEKLPIGRRIVQERAQTSQSIAGVINTACIERFSATLRWPRRYCMLMMPGMTSKS